MYDKLRLDVSVIRGFTIASNLILPSPSMLSITDDAYLPITIPYSNRISLLFTVCYAALLFKR